jgi:tRNA-Thr(GGU) m(6)t(6)A37 methyltransferase TsaA
MENEIRLKSIGVVHSPFKEPKGTPIQPTAALDVEATIEVFPEYVDGLKDLEGFSHIILLCYMHLASEPNLLVKPFMDDVLRGVFAVRAPSRPNSIGLSVVRLDRIEGNVLHIRDIDIIDGTPLLDIKPYVPEFDHREITKSGWLDENVGKLRRAKDDGRFAK